MDDTQPAASRRSFLKDATATAVGASVLGQLVVPSGVHAGEDETIKVGAIGLGGRGSGAVVDALSADPNTKLVAVGDAFEDRLHSSLSRLKQHGQIGDRVAVDENHAYWGFDAYKKVIDSDVDVVCLTTPPHFRPAHLKYAVDAGKHCFVEKPIAVDAPGVRSVMEACEAAAEKGLSIVSGLCWRYDKGVLATMERIQDGAIGDLIAVQSNYNTGLLWHRGDKPHWSRMEYQMRNWLYYTWLSGDHICEQAVHSIDKTGWLMGDTQPLKAVGLGGRQQRTGTEFGHIFDHHAVVYEYPNNVRVFLYTRQQEGCANHVDEFVMGTKGQAEILKHRIQGETNWRFRDEKKSMYQLEHDALFASIRNGEPINDGHYMCNSTMLAIMGRMCTYTGKELTWEQAFNSQERLGPAAYEWGDVPEPAVAIPGHTKFV